MGRNSWSDSGTICLKVFFSLASSCLIAMSVEILEYAQISCSYMSCSRLLYIDWQHSVVQ